MSEKTKIGGTLPANGSSISNPDISVSSTGDIDSVVTPFGSTSSLHKHYSTPSDTQQLCCFCREKPPIHLDSSRRLCLDCYLYVTNILTLCALERGSEVKR